MNVRNQQSLFDIAIAGCGDASAAFALALANGLSVTDDLIPGHDLTLPEVIDSDVTTFYANHNIMPATVQDTQVIAGSGIGFASGVMATIANMALKVVQGQTVLDLAIESAGDATAAFALALANNVSLTDDLTSGIEMQMINIINQLVVDYYTNNNIMPATAIAIQTTRNHIFSIQFSNIFA